MPPRRDRTHQDDATPPPPPPPPPQLRPYERASVDMLAGITRLLERQSERPEKSHEEDVAERFPQASPHCSSLDIFTSTPVLASCACHVER
ncbi:hypothetical protein F511_19526 [Dorcoceras hygrometricum]|uniref:Uncharacterized protein n=1 Tax=Dorcoceras hygrometricum TaxID=472368 RepID=A0A2Z7BYQ9_9LAMI|nr:hypothetical protein F511_19526 [Dorcoceras hygrometricum]